MSYNYNPQPPRVWSRVQHACSTINETNTINSLVYSYFSNQNVTPAVYEKEKQMLQKGNILQYKKNSSNLTKNQRYSKIAKGQWTNRTKNWATQSQTYSNPNTSNLLRVNYSELPVPLNAVLPLDCSSNFIKEGGNLICNQVVNPCTGEVIKTTHNINCYSTSDSDVPGPLEELCWNNRIQTWYPRQNLTMNNSLDKWPEGYKGFVSAVSPGAPYLIVDVICNIATLKWKIIFNDCLPVNSFNIYQNGILIENVPYTTTSINIEIFGNNTFYVTSISGTNESGPSNNVVVNYLPFTITGVDVSYNYSYANGYYIISFQNSNGYNQISSNYNIKFNQNIGNLNYVIVGGGGGGGSSYNYPNSGGGGGAGGDISSNEINNITCDSSYNIVVGYGGAKGQYLTGVNGNGGQGGPSSFYIYNVNGGQGGFSVKNGGGGGIGLKPNSNGGKGGIYFPFAPNIPAGDGISDTASTNYYTIPPSSSNTYYFSGGGSGGADFKEADDIFGGYGGGGCGGNSINYNYLLPYYGPNGIYYPAGSSTANGLISTGGGGSGQNGNGTSTGNMGAGGSGIVVLYFAYP